MVSRNNIPVRGLNLIPTDKDMPSIKCPKCHKESWSQGDIDNKYCGNCNAYHEDLIAEKNGNDS